MKTSKSSKTRSACALRLKAEISAMARQLPFRSIKCREFEKPGYAPHQIRQPRQYIQSERHTAGVQRFLWERGSVNLLEKEQVQSLFKEIHWCAHRIRLLARRKASTTRDWKQAATQARLLASQIEAAEEELYIANRRLIVKCVRHYGWIDPMLQEDFLQEGSRSLTHAVRKFDFRRGTPFVAYAQKAVQNRLRNLFRDHVRSGLITMRPSNDLLAVQQALSDWKCRHSSAPTDMQIAALTGLAEDRVRKTRILIASTRHLPTSMVSLDASLGHDAVLDLYDYVKDEKALDASLATERSDLWSLVSQLPLREQKIIRLRFMDGRTLEETGQMLRLTRARIKQIQDRALCRIRLLLTHQPLKCVA